MIQTTANGKSNNPMLQAALYYLSLGFVVIPIMKNAKKPRGEWKRYQKERPTEDEVREWFPEGSEANLAIVTGSASGVTVVDIDIGHDPWPPEGCQLPTGCLTGTPSGGRHCYVAYIPGVTTSAKGLPKGIHVRGDGGIAVVPPSTIDGKPYTIEEGSFEEACRTEAPGWLREALTSRREKIRTSSVPDRIAEGIRNTTLTSLAGSMRRRRMSEDAIRSALLIENERRCDPPLPEDEVISIAKSIGKKKASIESAAEPELSDGSNARRFVEAHGERLHYCPSDKSWYVWNGTLWDRDKTLQVETLSQKFILEQYAKTTEIEDNEKRVKWMKHVIKWESRKGIDSTIHLARSLDQVPVRLEELDGNDLVLNTQSCTIDFDQKEIKVLRRTHSPADLITKVCPTAYDPSAKSQVWDDFLKTATRGDKELELFLQRSAGYCLVGTNPEEKFFFIYGPTASGKSTFIEAVKAALGDYAVSINPATFLEQRSSGGAQPEVVKIKAARIVIASETEPGKQFNADLIKALAGRDTIACRDLYSKPIEFKFGGKLWLISNFAPDASIEDEAFFRRLLVIPFDNKIPEADRNPEVKTILTDPSISGAAILNWMVEGYLNYRDIGLAIPNSVLDSTRKYKEEINPIKDFVEDCCLIEPGNGQLTIASATLFDAYTNWATTNKVKYTMKKRKFGACLRGYGLQPERCAVDGKRVRTWTGVKLI